jgi:hypothetical protein
MLFGAESFFGNVIRGERTKKSKQNVHKDRERAEEDRERQINEFFPDLMADF